MSDNESISSNEKIVLPKNKRKVKQSDIKQIFDDVMEWVDEFKVIDEISDDKKIEKLPWVERFRPQKLDDVISHEINISTLKKLIKKNNMPHLLLSGPPGTGKTSTIMACMKELYGINYPIMVLEINASEERGIEVVRKKIRDFVTTKGFFSEGIQYSAYKMVILDEADAMTSDAQSMLVSMIEKYSMNIRFCLICNYAKKISPSIQSRCKILKFSPLDNKSISKKLKDIAKITKIKLTDDGIDTLIKISKGDMRRVLNILQVTSMIYSEINSNNITNCIGYPTEKNMNIIYESLIKDTFNDCYEKIGKIISINDYSINDIITEITTIILDKFINNKIKQSKFIKIISYMREIEMNLTVCPNEDIQLTGLIGSFRL
jgi:replication factor C subunit 3/5